MNLDKLDIELVERTPIQAINLGFVVARRYYKTLWLAALVAILPFYVLSIVLLWGLEWGWAFLAVWFFKPLYDRVLLENLSQLILHQPKTFSAIVSSIRPACRHGLLASLTWHRFSTIRSVSLPIRLLEGQTGTPYRLRLQALTKSMTASPSGVIVLFLALEQAIVVSMTALLITFLPSEWLDFGEFIDLLNGEAIAANCFFTTIYALVVLFLEPFFVAVGFSLYLNQRILSEAWDIDVIFRNMATRLSKRLSVIVATVLVGLCLVAVPTDVMATSSTTESTTTTTIAPKRQQQQLKEILADPDITPYKSIPVPKSLEDKSWLERMLDWLFDSEPATTSESTLQVGGLVKFLLLGALLVAVVYIVARYRHVLALFQKSDTQDIETPDVMFGLDVRADALPMNPESEALSLIDQGDNIGALSLLYRCSLSKLIHDGKLSIRAGDTEGDCLRASKPILSTQTYDYFSRLTNLWQNVVYAHQTPEKVALRTLATTWSAQRFSQHDAQVAA